jgi:hypothetical protein
MAGRAGRTKESKEGFVVIYTDDNEELKRIPALNDKYLCKSQIMQQEFMNNTINHFLMTAY